jgi:hypothetical protein
VKLCTFDLGGVNHGLVRLDVSTNYDDVIIDNIISSYGYSNWGFSAYRAGKAMAVISKAEALPCLMDRREH